MAATPLFTLSSVDIVALRQLATALGEALRPGDVVLLVGDLGAGKTTFTKQVAAALGVADEVTSPTFTIAHTYETGPSALIRSLMHLDAYRLRSADDLEAVGLFEALDDGAAAIIEWGDIVARAFDDPLWLALGVADETTRTVTCSANPLGSWHTRAAAFVADRGVR